LALIVSPYYADAISRTLEEHGHPNWVIGSVKAGEKRVTVHDK
jgi:phosphoribosylaminoimidazole (AIR) synthetase